ncbi:MAG: 3-isopropylmalate/(R)-2-methylmalate dehydratase small subunit [Cycloclasticus pugetii]|jgi:3-isopropylmalate/(R)-2-methylmalate dehydratase small subunit|uniref:3-isopropylmalate dehydratase small subunit n=1 Tax=Cycloclasticus zancles 78-ME TaxID=1198232 RepID=S5TA74_9GAMM|nr:MULTISPECIES: 3-isopropylmalate dehydratase small subunit [Cycloclasticus]AFT66372.1 3-isopropylmalate dehydratase small subunit [Cycloclasticus sp. P1]AGS40636.1 3-isopropylmalate/(R)-2-methylmalate dehydratase small subunit [Cycloclasticus zancles 78-ME]MBV1899213.1 3-isopropylmalate dehydratase small subunit [Cycloclasticus sp.]MDF1830410.1 3-isopropylmalate dehydratase small subunit [Cycloclasticus pugetii]PHR51572.1 MAG: 3-isopropylmalate dehydratase small subunit [Cycloclasticus sp.]|tara:strand:+ start:1210 stop:1824 length:615 start_codon:yes stop_codon:yes gene_type:complete
MEKYTKHESVAALMNRNNVDTDQIIPKQFLKKVERSGFGVHLFHDWRYLNDGVTPNPEFELNKPEFEGAKILVTGDNFGCGSSREHAPWAIADYGFNTIISTSYADIFYNNCFKNGILAIVVQPDQLDALMAEISANEGVSFTVDLENQTVTTPGGNGFSFEIDPFRKENMLSGLDDIGLTLKHVDKISAFEEQHKQRLPWLWA